MDGKLRLHVTFRWTDLAMRVETVDPVPLGEWSHVAVSYDGGMRAAGVRMYVDGKPQQLKVLFDSLLWPIDTKKHPWRVGAGGGLRFTGSVDEVRVYSRVLTPDETGSAHGAATDRFTRAHRITPNALLSSRASCVCILSTRRLRRNSGRWPPICELAGTERKVFLDSIPSVMVMKEREDRATPSS